MYWSVWVETVDLPSHKFTHKRIMIDNFLVNDCKLKRVDAMKTTQTYKLSEHMRMKKKY